MLMVRPIELRDANNFVARLHRHHKPVVGHRFSISAWGKEDLCAWSDAVLHGVAIVGRPVSRGCDPLTTCEVTRLCTDGTRNACSLLYSAAARAAKAMGFQKIQTYILAEEQGASLRASGWELESEVKGRQWVYSEDQSVLPFEGYVNRRTDQPTGDKTRWARRLN